jgi:polyisoprenoid-binding protein YceI
MVMTMMRPGVQLEPGARLRPAAGNWRVDPARSYVSFSARAAGRHVRGRLPLTGRVLITEPVEGSTAWLAASAGRVSTGSRTLDRELAGPSFLDAWAFPEISFRSELLAWVPAGWRAVGRLRVKGTEHELACQLDLDRDSEPAGDSPYVRVTGGWTLDSRWITPHWIPGLSRCIPMTCSLLLEPDLKPPVL